MGEELRERVKERYAVAARSVLDGAGSSSCWGRRVSAARLGGARGGLDRGGYSAEELGGLPQAAGASLGCGNPTALATLSAGGGLGPGQRCIDVLLSARRVFPGGKAYGLDMTDEMLELAEKNRAEAGAENAQFLGPHRRHTAA